MSSLQNSDENKEIELIKKIIQDQDSQFIDNIRTKLDEIESFIKDDFVVFSQKDSPPNSLTLYSAFEYEFSKFEEFAVTPSLSSKNIVGIGGAFSSGKSTFINSFILKDNLLPWGTDPSTSVPTYVINGNDLEIKMLNIFNRVFAITNEEIRLINHDFATKYKVSLAGLVKSIFVTNNSIGYDNIAFLDTPGFFKDKKFYYSENTDDKIALEQLNSCNYIIWMIDISKGELTKPSLEVLSKINKGIPVLVILGRCEKSPDEIEAAYNQIKTTMERKGIKFVGLLRFSARNPEGCDSDKLRKILDEWNKKPLDITFTRNFKRVFTAYNKYYQRKLDDEKKRLNKINHAIGLTDDDNRDVVEYLKIIKTEADVKISNLKSLEAELDVLKKTFFTKIKEVGDFVGIPLPEPSAVDEIVDYIVEPLDIVKSYMNDYAIKDSNFKYLIQSILSTAKATAPAGFNIKYLKRLETYKAIINRLEPVVINIKFVRDTTSIIKSSILKAENVTVKSPKLNYKLSVINKLK